MLKAKAYLQQAKKIDRMIRNKEAEKLQWKMIALDITSHFDGEAVKGSKNPQKMQNAIVTYVDLEREINCKIDELVNKKKEILSVIEQLPENEYDLLHKVYIQFLTLKEAAAQMDKTYSWATTCHGVALNHVQKILEKMQD